MLISLYSTVIRVPDPWGSYDEAQDLSVLGHHWESTKLFITLHNKAVSLPWAVDPISLYCDVPSACWYVVDRFNQPS